jgi:membrane-bound metal-dependent hydrolase YbcI (DUF457 family)
MAGWKGHVAGGFICIGTYTAAISFLPIHKLAEAAGLLQDWHVLAAIFVVGALFAIFPDIDTNSKAQDLFFGIAFVLDVLLIVLGAIELAAYLGLIAMLPIISHHRGWTHRLWAMVIVPLPILIVPFLYKDTLLPITTIYYGAAVIGYGSHLLFDGLIWHKLSRLFK